MSETVASVGLSICTACGETYRYRGHLHCPPGSPVTIEPKPDCIGVITERTP